MSTLSTTNLKNPSSGSNNIVLGTGGDTTVTNNLTVSGTGNHSIAGTLQFNSGYGSVATAYGCRAWVNFNGTGVVAIRASGNVSSITDNGTGDYTVNFTTAMPDANYCLCGNSQLNGSSGNGNGNTVVTLNRIPANALTTSSARIVSQALDGSGTAADSLNMCVSIFR